MTNNPLSPDRQTRINKLNSNSAGVYPTNYLKDPHDTWPNPTTPNTSIQNISLKSSSTPRS